MSEKWNTLTGELRAALASRDWSRAGAAAWQLRQIDEGRYQEQLAHYTSEQCRAGGHRMALETEQRLEAIRQWVREVIKFNEEPDLHYLLGQMSRGESFDVGNLETLGEHVFGLFPLVGAGGHQRLRVMVRADIQDVIWSELQTPLED